MARRIVDGTVDQRTICDSGRIRVERGYIDSSLLNLRLNFPEHDPDSEFEVLGVRDISLHHFIGLEDGEYEIDGNERVRRVKEAGLTPLDVYVLIALLRHQDKIPIPWKEKTRDGIGIICFDGTTHRDANYVPCNPGLSLIRGNWVACQVRKDQKRNQYTYSAVVKRV
jgi:hypothetical protein